MGEQERWQVAGSAPELYQRYLVPAMTSMWADDLVDASALRVGDRVLEVADALSAHSGNAGLNFPQEVHRLLARK